MKLWLLVIATLLCIHLVLCKTTPKNYRKKVNGWKKRPIKNVKTPLDEFTNLPPEDYQFIKELDKQFKLHGNRLKIKVERDNSTSKSIKRNIDGDVGYGYQDVNHGQAYHFSPPKYSIYPYSQHDIPPAHVSAYNGHRRLHHTVVNILPSKSFEIQENPIIFTTGNQQHYEPQYTGADYSSYQHHQPATTQYVQPVIVLRIPGPSKYAAHLQTLLQQYIEIRAAQILKELEESEQQQHQHQQQQNHAEPNYQQNLYAQNEGGNQHDHHQDYFPPIEQVYHIRGRRPQPQPQSQHQHQIQIQQQEQVQHQPHVVYGPPVKDNSGYDEGYYQSQDYQHETQTEAVSSYHHQTTSGYQYHIPVYVPEQSHHHQADYSVQPQPVYGVPTQAMYAHHHHDDDESELKISENNPRETHTRVHFTEAIKNDDHSTAYPLPSVTTPTRNVYLSPKEDSNYQYQESHDNYQHLESDYQSEQPVVEITQRPFNYHAHRAKLIAKGQKRDALRTIREPQIQKFSKIIITRIKKNSPEKSFGNS